MEIADYIPNYPELTNSKFNKRILHKKEFYDLRTDAEANPFGEPGDLWPHQRLLARFFSPETPYNENLLFHTPGTGKTCAASAIVEINKQDRLVRKPVLIIVPNDSLAEQWRQQIAFVCTDGEYIPEHYFSIDPATRLTDAKKVTRLKKLLRPIYHITTLDKMSRHIDKHKGASGDQILRNKYSNTIIIIDEAHNLRIQANTSKKKINESKGRYKAFHRFLHLVVNSKILLLSGTPLYDRITELPGLMNLILPLDQQLPPGKAPPKVEGEPKVKTFSEEYLREEDNVYKIVGKDKLSKHLVGRVSYIREGGSFPQRINLGKTVWTKFLKTVNVKMSSLQVAGYKQAYTKDTKKKGSKKKETEKKGPEEKGSKKKRGLWKNSRQAAVFIYQNEQGEYLWGTAASGLLTIKQKTRTITISNRPVTITPIQLNPKYKKDLKDNLGQYSAKYQEIVDYVLAHKNQPIFIFTPLVSGAGGAIFLGLILGLFDYAKANGTEKDAEQRYALITGEEKSSLQRKALLNMFNSKENANGELIQIMVATMTIAEGTSFTNVRHVIVVSPYWNNSGTEQAIGRGLRANSLAGLSQEERTVTVQELSIESSKIPKEENIDARMYKKSETKDYEIKEGERLLKKVAWDCALNYARNVRKMDKDYSRNCDYQRCNYVCYQTTPEKVQKVWTYTVPPNKLDDSTYLLYYSEPDMLQVVEKIKEKLRMYSYINVSGLRAALDMDNFKLLILAIEHIIENHVTVYNKWGQACFLRKEGNMLFLSDVPTEKEILGSWYARYPYANQQTPLDQIIDNELLATDAGKLENIDLKNTAQAQQIINSMNLESKIFILETLLQMEPEQMTPKQQKLLEIFKSLFSTHIFTIEDVLIHDLEKTKLALDYVDFATGDDGTLRCFQDGAWIDCEKKLAEKFTTVIKDIKEAGHQPIIDNKYGLFGKLGTDNKFRIVDKLKEATAKKTDRRTKHPGKVCNEGGWKKWELIEIYLRVGAKPSIPIDTSIKNVADLKTAIKKNGAARAIPANATIATLQKIYTLSGQQITTLCDQVQEWFEKNNLVIKE